MSKKNLKAEDLIELMKDEKVADAMLSHLSIGIQATIDKHFTRLEERFTERMERLVEKTAGELVKRAFEEQNIKINQLEDENKLLKQRVDEYDVLLRLDNLIIHGLTEESNITSTDGESIQPSIRVQSHQPAIRSVLDLCQTQLGIEINESDISLAYRIQSRPTGRGGPTSRPVFVKFLSRNVRNRVFAARKSLRDRSRSDGLPRIYINEHLTKNNAFIYAQARAMVKEQKLTSTWTANGYVFARYSTSPSEKPKKILQMKDLT
jgi:hypothetical protein